VLDLEGVAEVSAFADDLAVWWSDRSVDVCSERLQDAADRVVEWCDRWLMCLAESKCTLTLFSLSPADKSMERLKVRVRGGWVNKEEHPRFLGVTFDRGLRFQTHVDTVVPKVEKRLKILRRLAGTDWGWNRDLLRATYRSLILSVMLYGVGAWGPWLSKTGWERLERLQLEAGRIIGGLLRSSPREAVLAQRCVGCCSGMVVFVCLRVIPGVIGALLGRGRV
jgi:hypothetical protein